MYFLKIFAVVLPCTFAAIYAVQALYLAIDNRKRIQIIRRVIFDEGSQRKRECVYQEDGNPLMYLNDEE